ncbi:uncharacterized protein [Mytilus edulis]|uniref:uncharacterized protein isoform X2 n=1 Tax=Mytilus edulis TaxID=6550 RepID=UPI0039EF2EED
MTLASLYLLVAVCFFPHQCKGRSFYSRRTFRIGGFNQNGFPIPTPTSGNIQNGQRFSNWNGQISNENLGNIPTGTVVLTSRTTNMGGPGKSTTITRTITPGKTSVVRKIQNIPHSRFTSQRRITHTGSNNNKHIPGSKTFQKKWWSQTVNSSRKGSNSQSSIQKSNNPVWSKTIQIPSSNSKNVDMSSIFNQMFSGNVGNNSSSDFPFPKDFLSNLPPGAHVKISSSSSSRVIPKGRVIQSIRPGVGKQFTKVVSTNGNRGIKYDEANNQPTKQRVLPQPSASIKRGVKCDKKLCEHEKYKLLENHNKVRRSVRPSAANMKKLIWDVDLERRAQKYAKKCIWTHDKKRSKNAPYRYVGQNMHARRGARDILTATRSWEKEQDHYNIYTNNCVPGEMCGHYTQMVWADTETVGCAMWKCPYIHNLGWRDAYIVVCDYGPGGNIGGEKPYRIEQKCAECSKSNHSCDNGLCV